METNTLSALRDQLQRERGNLVLEPVAEMTQQRLSEVDAAPRASMPVNMPTAKSADGKFPKRVCGPNQPFSASRALRKEQRGRQPPYLKRKTLSSR
jgi:hypothetical protein